MVRETRHLWVGNLPENVREERIREHFKRYGRVQSVKLLPGSNGSLCAAVAFMDIKSASKAHNCEHTLDEHALSTEYYEPGPYTSSQQRFPIGISDDHSTFDRTSHFYERGSSTPGTPLASTGTRSEVDGYLRRSSVYHAPPDPLRGRPRDRPYRNGPPYPPGTERSSNNRRNWAYETGAVRYLSSSEDHAGGPGGTGVPAPGPGSTVAGGPVIAGAAPPKSSSSSSAAAAAAAAKKVRSGSESRSGSQSSRSRSPTRSTTGSPPSSDSSTRSESPRSTRVSVQSTVAPPVQQTTTSSSSSSSTLAVYSEDRRPLAICVRNLPTRSSDTSLKDGLFHEYKKHGKVTWVKVVGAANERYALVCFKKPEDVEKAIEVSQDKLFFGCKIDVAPYHGYDVEDNEARPYDTELDEYHPKATRTLFIGNLEKDVTAGDIRQHFDQFGEIIEIDIKKQPGVTSSYAFCQYADIGSVVQAMRTLDGELLGESRLKLGFGKSMASSCVWIAGVVEQVSDKYLDLQFRKFGPVSHVVVDRERGQALIFYEQVSAAAAAVKEMRGLPLRGNRIQIDFASRECQEAFYERIDAQGRDNNWSSFEPSRSERDILCSRYDSSSRFRYDPARVRSSSYSRSSGSRTPRRHEVYDSPRYKSYEELSPSSDHDEYPSNEAPDLRHLHKERNHLQHLLDQLDRPLRSVTAADQGLVVTTHNHRRRLSSHQRSSGEGPAPLCKRRKTGSTSEDERRKHHHHHSGDERRPGTPLFDEKPDNVQPQEPRRMPRERPEEPLSLPLPQFAAQCFTNAKSTSGGVGSTMSQPSSSSSTTPSAASLLQSSSTSSLCGSSSTPSATAQQAPPPPASPVRPPSPSSTTSSSEISPQSPTLEERIRSLDEKYEKWTGRTLQPPTKPKHRLLDVDVRELQPSDIVKSVLAKPSVFDEDSKRLENFGEKYEPRDFSSYPRSVGLDVQRFVPGDPRNPSYISNLSVKVSPLNSPSGVLLSPCPAAKGLQYPFPSHPPVQPTTSVATTTAGSSSPPAPVVRPISKSVEFSVQKAESWLGITKDSSTTATTAKDSLISGGFNAQRFATAATASATTTPKVADVPSPRHTVMKLTDIATQKIDIPGQKSNPDPRLDKSSLFATSTTSVLSQRVAAKSSNTSSSSSSDVAESNPQKHNTLSGSFSSTNTSNKVCTGIGSGNAGNSAGTSSNNSNSNSSNSGNSNSNVNSNHSSNNGNSSTRISGGIGIGGGNNNNSVSGGVDRSDCFNGDNVALSKKESELCVSRRGKDEDVGKSVDGESARIHRVNCVVRTDEGGVVGDSSKGVAAVSGSGSCLPVSSSSEASATTGTPTVPKVKSKAPPAEASGPAGAFSSDKSSIGDSAAVSAPDSGPTVQNCESTKKLDSSLLKLNNSNSKTANVILPEAEGGARGLTDSAKSGPGGKANANATSANGSTVKAASSLSSSTKISVNSVKLLSETADKLMPVKSACSYKDESSGYHGRDRDREFGSSDVSKASTRDRDRDRDGRGSTKEERSGREADRSDKAGRDKATAEKDRERDRDRDRVGRDRSQKSDREMPENVDKERKKDREVESERKKDRESMEVIEREKRRENDLERKKDQSDVLDRRKGDGTEKRSSQDSDRPKKKDEDKERKKEKDGTDKRKDSHSLERHKKSSLDEKKRDSDVEGKKKEKSSSSSTSSNSNSVQPASIGSKRRISSQDSIESGLEDAKRSKTEHKRRDSKDSKSFNSLSAVSGGGSSKVVKSETKSQDSKVPNESNKHSRTSTDVISSSNTSSSSSAQPKSGGDSKSQEYKRKDESERKKCSSEADKRRDSRKSQNSKGTDEVVVVKSQATEYKSDKAMADGPDDKKHSHVKKESREKKRSATVAAVKQEFGSTESLDDKKGQRKEKRKKEDESVCTEGKRGPRDKPIKVEAKKENGHDTDTDSDSEPKKHSIFDVVLDEPAYISMYDKVKARSCKNMQKQEEEKRQVKLKEKFSQLKQSRAKREEKKRSTSWDEDSDSDTSQIRRMPRRSFSRLSSEDEGITKREKKSSESWDGDNRRSKKSSYDTASDDESGVGVKVKNVHTSDVYTDESDAGFAETDDKLHRKFNSKCKTRNVFESSEEESVKRPTPKENFHSTNPEKIDGKGSKVRLSLDSSTDRFCYEGKTKKRTLTESVSEGEPSYMSAVKAADKLERKKSKKKDKRQKSVEGDISGKVQVDSEYSFTTCKVEMDTKPSTKPEKQERRKSVPHGSEAHEDAFKQRKNKSLSSSSSSSKGSNSHYDVAASTTTKTDDIKYERMFDNFSDDSNDHHVQSKGESKSSGSSKWQVAQVYGTDSDSNGEGSENVSEREKPRKVREKKKKDKKSLEHSDELVEAGRALEKMLSSPPQQQQQLQQPQSQHATSQSHQPSRRDSEDVHKYCDSSEDFAEDKLKVMREKKKKRKKSKDEKSSRHYYHHHHGFGSGHKTESAAVPAETKPDITTTAANAHISPSLPTLLDGPPSPTHIKQETVSSPTSSPRARSSTPSRASDKILPAFGYELDEKVHETAVQSIALLDVKPKIEPKVERKETGDEVGEKAKEESGKERTVISQEETEDAVAALLGETFSYSTCFEGNSPVETDPEQPHDEEEMRQAVQSLNEGKPDTPQSESGLQIDTDAEEPEEQFNGLRYETLPRTPDLDLSQPPKTPDIQTPYVVEAKAFPRKDTTRNSREEMEVPIVDPPSPDPLVPYQSVETEPKDKEMDLKPPILKPASPKHYKDEPPTIEPVSSITGPERIYVENRLLLHPPPLVPVAKPVSMTTSKPSPSLSIVRPMISLSTSNAPPTLLLTPIRTTAPLGPSTHPSTQVPRKTFTISTTTPTIITTTRSSIPPPILSPVTPSLSSPVKLTAPSSTEAAAANPPRFATSAAVVSSQHLPGHLIPQKIILHQVSRAVPTRLIPTQGSVVKVVDSSGTYQSSPGEMPALALSEPAPTGTLSTPAAVPATPPAQVPSSSAAAPISGVDLTRSEGSQTTSVISVLPRSAQVSMPQQVYSRAVTSSCVVNPLPVPVSATATVPSPMSTSVISVHSTVADVKHTSGNVIHQTSAPPKILNFATLQKVPGPMPVSQAPVEDKPAHPPDPPRHSSVIEGKPVEESSKTLDLHVPEITHRPGGSEPEKTDEDKKASQKKETVERVEAGEVKPHEVETDRSHHGVEQQLQHQQQQQHSFKTMPEQTESVIKKVDSLSSLKSEESIHENVDACDKSDTSSINQDDASRQLSSEEDTKQVHSMSTRKGRKKGGRGGVVTRKGKQTPPTKPADTQTPGKRGGRAQRGGKSPTDLGKKQSKDVYEFHDESDDDGSGSVKERPRLILTIKSPNSAKDQAVPPSKIPTAAATAVATTTATAVVAASATPTTSTAGAMSAVVPAATPVVAVTTATKSPKEATPVKSPDQKATPEKDVGPLNTRKSRRLQEKDGYRNTVDDVIEDVVRNGGHRKATSPRRSLRQVATKTSPALPVKKMATRTAKKSAASLSAEDDVVATTKEGEVSVLVKTPDSSYADDLDVTPPTVPKTVPTTKDEQEAEGETSDEEPTTLIDPVTGMLMVMRAKEEGKYVPVANVPPVAPPTPPPPPPPTKPENLPIVTEGLASHWLTNETLKQAVIKVQTYGEGNKVNPVFMNRPPTPPTTPQTRIQEPVTRLPVEMMKKVTVDRGGMLEPEPVKPDPDLTKHILHPMELSKQKICHVDQGKVYPELARVGYANDTGRPPSLTESGKMLRPVAKPVMPTVVNKAVCSTNKAHVPMLASPNKQLYQSPKHVKMPPQNQILTGAVASSPPRVVKTTPPAHELHPMTGAVASPPPRAPHLTSQQPIVTGASSSRALIDPPKGPGASPRGMTLPPYEATLQTPTQNLHSPPPAHQQGDGMNMSHMGHPPFVHPQLMYQQYLRAQEMLPSPYQLTASLQGKLEERERERGAGDMGRSPPLELRSQRATDSPTVYMGRQQYSRYYEDPPPAHIHQVPDAPGQPRLQIATPPHASQVPPQADSLLMLLQRYPIMWQGLLALKNDQSAVQMHFVFGNPHVARDSLPCNSDGSTPPLRIAQRMRLEQTQLEGVARKMQMDNEHCMLLALPCGRDHMDVLQQSTNLQTGFITYLQQKQAAGIVNIAHPGSQQAAYVVHIFPSCEFANENLARNAPDLLHRMQEIPHLLIVIATV